MKAPRSEQTEPFESMGCPDAQTLADLLLEKLNVSTSNRLKAHIDGCANCREFVKKFREMSQTHAATTQAIKVGGRPGSKDAADETIYPLQGSRAAGSFHLPGYRVAEELGRGGMGVVFRAVQENLNRPVAIKMILAGGLSKPEDQARFQREGAALAKFSHPNFVQIYDLGSVDLPTGPQPYMILEYADGGNLREWMGIQPLAPREAAHLVAVLARALDVAHAQGIVHRDLKPANILLQNEVRVAGNKSNPKLGSPSVTLTREGGPSQCFVPKISDFGLVKQLELADGLTVTGNIMGTPAYMAPEQYGLSPRGVGPAVDVYALGGILYNCLTAQPPFGMNSGDTVPAAPTESPPAPSEMRPDLPPELDDIVLRCLERDPSQRYATAGEIADDLEAWLAKEDEIIPSAPRVRRPKPKPAKGIPRVAIYGAALLAVIVLSVGLTVIARNMRPPGPPPKDDHPVPGKLVRAPIDDPEPPERPKVGPKGVAPDPKPQPAPPPPPIGPPAKVVSNYLHDLQPTSSINWPFTGPKKDFQKKGPPNGKGPPDGKGPPEGKEPPPDFASDTWVGGKMYTKAIFMHPPGFGDFAKITYKVPAGYTGFRARATMRDDQKGNGSMNSAAAGVMIVFGADGKTLWEHRGMHSQADARDCMISIAGQSAITIATTCDAEPMGAHLVWIDPRFTKPAP